MALRSGCPFSFLQRLEGNAVQSDSRHNIAEFGAAVGGVRGLVETGLGPAIPAATWRPARPAGSGATAAATGFGALGARAESLSRARPVEMRY